MADKTAAGAPGASRSAARRPHPRPEISSVVPGAHGGTDVAASESAGVAEEAVLDFSASVSPFGPAPGVAQAISGLRLDAYPDPACLELRRALAAYTRMPEARILPTAGSTEAIRLIAQTYLRRGVRTLALSPAFSEYAPAARLMGSPFESFGLTVPSVGTADARFNLDEDAFVDWVAARLPAVLFLNDPHNPTGVILGRKLVERLLGLNGELLAVVDEAYRDFLEDPMDLTPLIDGGRLVLMRSLTKAQALAGVRLGYLIAHEGVLNEVRRALPPWTVSSIAQAAGVETLRDMQSPGGGHTGESMRRLRNEKAALVDAFRASGFDALDSETCFFLVRWSGSPADSVRDQLLRSGVRVRSCASFGMPSYIRISARGEADNRRLLEVMRGQFDAGPVGGVRPHTPHPGEPTRPAG